MAEDSETEFEDVNDINGDQPGNRTRKPKRNPCVRFLRKQFNLNCCGCITSIFYTVIVFYSAISFHKGNYSDAAMKPLELTKEFTGQIRDWAVTPYTEIRIQNTTCNGSVEPLFQRYWNGTKASRYCYNEGNCTVQQANNPVKQSLFWRVPEISNTTTTNETDTAGLNETDTVNETAEISYINQYICAKRGGKSYLNATLPVDDLCPAGTQACSSETTGLNTICFDTSKGQSDCPILDIKFVTDPAGYEDYEIVLPYADIFIAATKIYKDSGPITSTKVAPIACLDPDEQDSPNSQWHKDENDANKTICNRTDEAYVKLENFQVNQL